LTEAESWKALAISGSRRITFDPSSIKNTARGLPGLADRGIAVLLKILRLSIDKY